MRGSRGDYFENEQGEGCARQDLASTLEKSQGFTLMLTQEIKPSALRNSPSARRPVAVEASNPPEGATPSRSPNSRSKVAQAHLQGQDPPFSFENTTSSISVVDQLNTSGQQGRSTQLVQGHSHVPLGQKANMMRNTTQAGGDRPTYLSASSQYLQSNKMLSPQHQGQASRGPNAAHLLEMGYRMKTNSSLPPVQSPLKSHDSRTRHLHVRESGDGFPLAPADEAAE